ncbi:hypothetical protein PFISCL1PPCAC_821, partial [Pristionchus fissidentatus]
MASGRHLAQLSRHVHGTVEETTATMLGPLVNLLDVVRHANMELEVVIGPARLALSLLVQILYAQSELRIVVIVGRYEVLPAHTRLIAIIRLEILDDERLRYSANISIAVETGPGYGLHVLRFIVEGSRKGSALISVLKSHPREDGLHGTESCITSIILPLRTDKQKRCERGKRTRAFQHDYIQKTIMIKIDKGMVERVTVGVRSGHSRYRRKPEVVGGLRVLLLDGIALEEEGRQSEALQLLQLRNRLYLIVGEVEHFEVLGKVWQHGGHLEVFDTVTLK